MAAPSPSPSGAASQIAVDHSEDTPRSADGTRLYLQRWAPTGKAPVAETLILHGFFEHSGRYRELAHSLAGAGIASTAIDYRGHGRADGPRGHVSDFARYYEDVEVGLRALRPGVPHFLLGHSHGGLLALGLASSRSVAVKGLVVTNPFLGITGDIPAWKVFLGQVMAKVAPSFSQPGGLDTKLVSHDEAVCEAYARDPLRHDRASAGWFVALEREQQRVMALRQVDLPLLYVYSRGDRVVDALKTRTLAEKLASPDKTLIDRGDEFHEVLNETNRLELHAAIAAWMTKRAG